MTPHEFQTRYDVDAKRLRGYLRKRWPHHPKNDPWYLSPAMASEAKAHFGIASSPSAPIVERRVEVAGAITPTRTVRSAGLHRELFHLAIGVGIPLAFGAPVAWLSGQGHLNPMVAERAPTAEVAALTNIHLTLGGSAKALAGKRPGNPPVPDLVHVPTGCLIEVDEIQHFTTARLRTFDLYPPTELGYDVGTYRAAVVRHKSKGDRAFAHKVSVDFPNLGGRQAQRAYNDALRDLLAPTFTGHGVVRIPVPDRRIDQSTLGQLLQALERLR